MRIMLQSRFAVQVLLNTARGRNGACHKRRAGAMAVDRPAPGSPAAPPWSADRGAMTKPAGAANPTSTAPARGTLCVKAGVGPHGILGSFLLSRRRLFRSKARARPTPYSHQRRTQFARASSGRLRVPRSEVLRREAPACFPFVLNFLEKFPRACWPRRSRGWPAQAETEFILRSPRARTRIFLASVLRSASARPV